MMAARLKPETIASDLRVPERKMLFCLASAAPWERAGVTHATAQQLLVRGLVDRHQSAGRCRAGAARGHALARVAHRLAQGSSVGRAPAERAGFRSLWSGGGLAARAG